MPAITLPDGSVRSFDAPVSGAEIAADIGPFERRRAVRLGALRTRRQRQRERGKNGQVKDACTHGNQVQPLLTAGGRGLLHQG